MLSGESTITDASPWVLSLTRRVLEFALAAIALVAFLPLMALVVVLVRLDSEGPAFFRQERMGRGGRAFTLFKFRSMRLERRNHPCITVSGDTRITPVGALLRRFKLDELPQFWNVLRGDMGLVGPRPKLPHHEGLYLACRPGITGAATLAFRNEESLLSDIPEDQLEIFYETYIKPAKAELDLQYMRTATLWSDLRILFRTAFACFASSETSPVEPAARLAEYGARLAAQHKAEPASSGLRPVKRPVSYSASLNPEL